MSNQPRGQVVDAETQAYRNTMEGMFSSKGVDELAPPPKFDYKTYELEERKMHDLMGRVTDALIAIEDKTGRFRYSCMSTHQRHDSSMLIVVPDGRIIDSISWNFWEWPQAVGESTTLYLADHRLERALRRELIFSRYPTLR